MPAFLCRNFRERITFGDTAYPYSQYQNKYPVERLEDYPGCREGLERVLVLPWTERHNSTHVDLLAEQISRAVERLTRVAGNRLMEHA